MDAESQFMLLAAPLLFLAGSLGLGYYFMQYFGFSFDEFIEYKLDYEERAKTELGQIAEPPLLMIHSKRRFFSFGLLAAPALLNALLLGVLYWYDLFHFVALLLVPILVIEFVTVRWLVSQVTPRYRADLDRYFALTDPKNRMVEATVRDYQFGLAQDEIASARLLSGGSIITAIVPANERRGEELLELFQPSEVHIPKAAFQAAPGRAIVRLYYRSERFAQGAEIDGVIIGMELLAPLPEPMTYREFEAGLTVN